MRHALVILGILVLQPNLCAERDKSPKQRQQEELREAKQRLDRNLRVEASDRDLEFIREQAQQILARAAAEDARSYRYGRLEEALDDLLDAGEELTLLLREGNRKDTEGQRKTALELENAYFRVTQAEYFAQLSSDEHGKDYVRLARTLYQKARREYDAKQYWRARRYGDASREIVNTLEALAQSVVRVPNPPELK
jgi:hypothetical protein